VSKRSRIVAIGEILWDLLPSGKQLGGAPANFAYHAHALGADARLISRVGNDALGREIIDRVAALGLPTDGIAIDQDAPTGTVTVDIRPDGQPDFIIHNDVAWDHISIPQTIHADVVCFGSLAQRSPTTRRAICDAVAATPPTTLRIFDINLRQNYFSREVIESSLKLANALKLNDAELPVLAAMFGLSELIQDQLSELSARFGIRSIALTRGSAGSLLLTDGVWSAHPGVQVDVVDAVGAGDAFTAAWTLGLLTGKSLDTINQEANELAAFVCTQPGATPSRRNFN
jgi:fructokinase